MSKHWDKATKERFHKSVSNFQEAMKNHEADRKGQVIAIDFTKRQVIKSKCRKGRVLKSA